MILPKLQSIILQVLFVAIIMIGAVGFYVTSSLATTDATSNAGEPDELAQWGLPLDLGREEVEIYCSACHSLRLVAQQGLTKDDWDELFDWMVEEQEMEEIPVEDRKLVLDYLSKHRGIDRKLKKN